MHREELNFCCLYTPQARTYLLSTGRGRCLSSLCLTSPSPIDLACWSRLYLPLAPPSPSSAGLCGPFYIGIHITLKRSSPCRLSLTAPPIVLVCWLPLHLPPVCPSPSLEGLCRPPLMPLLYGYQ